MKKLSDNALKEIIQSGHINLLIGSGASKPYLPTLEKIEAEMNADATKLKAQKEYYGIVKKSKSVLDESMETDTAEKKKLSDTKDTYDKFIRFWTETLSNRYLNIVNKQVNVFTTNFDMFIEDSCERLEVPYNDGFSGQLKPRFRVANFNKVQKYKSLQFDNTSDIPLFNIIKVHGSTSWMAVNEDIVYSDGSHISNELDGKQDEEFQAGYNKIAVVNPNAEKHFATVLDINYASMLRKFTLELEKENSVLLVFGFSLEDKHIKDLLYGVMKSNPTLMVVYFSFSPYDELSDLKEEAKNANLYIITPESGSQLPFDKQADYLENVLYPKNKEAFDPETEDDNKEK